MTMRLIKLFLLLATMPLSCGAVPVPATTIKGLIHNSDLVAIVFVSQIKDAGTSRVEISGKQYDAREYIANLEQIIPLKGSVEATVLRVKFSLPSVWVGYPGLPPNEYRVVFLKKSE